MSTSPIISVIVPMYNVENYIRKCLKSLQNQKFKDFEVLMINDGSPDKTVDIAREFAKKDKRFRLIHRDNGGLSAARNTGIKFSKGEYLSFVDGDDFVSPTYLLTMYNAIISTGADMAYCRYRFNFPKNDINVTPPLRMRKQVASSQKAMKMLISDFVMHHYAWNKLYKKSLFTDNNIRYLDMYFEDISTTPRLLYYANKIAITDDYSYYYVKRPGSIMATMNAKKINDYVGAYGIMRNFYEQKNCYPQYRTRMRELGWRIKYINYYSVLKMHTVSLCPRGVIENLKNSRKTLYYFKSDNYKVCNGIPKVPYPVVQPENNLKKIKYFLGETLSYGK